MNLSLIIVSILLALASSKPFTITNTATERHIIRHEHKINCLNCFCGDDAIERARHACTPDRDLVLCPPSAPLHRVCYRCACFPRTPVSPSPPAMAPIAKPRDDKDDKVQKHSDDDHDDDHDDDKNHKHGKDDDNKGPEQSKDKNGNGHKHDKEDNDGDLDMATPAPEDDDDRKEKPHPRPSQKPSRKPAATPSARECAMFERGGGGGNTVFDVDLLRTSGTFKVSWMMDSVPDMVEIYYEGKKIYSTKVPVSGHGSAYINYSGSSSFITVWVTSPTAKTGWFMKFGCPTSQ